MSQTALEGSLNLHLEGSEYDPLKHLAIVNPMERRALALRFAIDSKSVILLRDDTIETGIHMLIHMAKQFDAYIVGEDAY